jgi:hypothetical protein
MYTINFLWNNIWLCVQCIMKLLVTIAKFRGSTHLQVLNLSRTVRRLLCIVANLKLASNDTDIVFNIYEFESCAYLQ